MSQIENQSVPEKTSGTGTSRAAEAINPGVQPGSNPTSAAATTVPGEPPKSAKDKISLAKNNMHAVFGQGVGRISQMLMGAVFVTMLAYGGSKIFSKPKLPESEQGAAVNIPNNAGNIDHMAPVSTEEAARRAQANALAASNAANAGNPYIAAPIVADANLDHANTSPDGLAVGSNVVTNPNNMPPPVAPAPQMGGNGGQQYAEHNSGGNQAAAPPPAQVEVDSETRKKVDEQIAGIMMSAMGMSESKRGFATFYMDEPPKAVAAQQAGGGAVVNSNVNPAAMQGAALMPVSGGSGQTIAGAGDTCFATFDNGISTDDTAIVLATVHACNFEGGDRLRSAKLIGSLEKAQDQARVVFNKMRLPNTRTTIPVEAIAVTEDEARSGIGKDVNKHYLSRYLSLGIASLLTGYGKAALQDQGTMVVTPNGTTTISNAPMTVDRQRKIALGEMGQAFGNEVRRDFERPTTVSSPRGMGIGVIFVSDVIPK